MFVFRESDYARLTVIKFVIFCYMVRDYSRIIKFVIVLFYDKMKNYFFYS